MSWRKMRCGSELVMVIVVMLMAEHHAWARRPHNPQVNVTANSGLSVELKCKVRLLECGNFFSIEWYRQEGNVVLPDAEEGELKEMGAGALTESERVYVYRHHTGQSKSEGRWEGRAEHVYDTKRHLMKVRLSQLTLQDEASYRCEITYEEAGRWFKHTCLAAQVTQLSIIGKPEFSGISLENGTYVKEAAIIGPFHENALLVLRCKAEGGRPIPEVSWWLGSSTIANAWHMRYQHDNGSGSTQSEINLLLTREHLGKSFECLVNSSALESPLRHSVHIDMEVPPFQLQMSGNFQHDQHIAEGGNISATCRAAGAKPPAYIYWNSDPPMSEDDTHEEIVRDDNGITFTTINTLTFRAQRQLTSLSCFASNKALDDNKEVHLKRDTNINVKYKPEVQKMDQLVRIQAVHGEPINLLCQFSANPEVGVKVKWFRNRLPLTPDSDQDTGPVLRMDADKNKEGLYSCSAENELGLSSVVDVAVVNVQEIPHVMIEVDPEEPVSEAQNTNVTLICKDMFGDSSSFHSVKWFLDGELLKHVEKHPECYRDTQNISIPSHHCNVDPSKIILVNVRRLFRGNYSCKAKNRAGWGPLSEDRELFVFYPPRSTKLSFEPAIIYKDKPFQLKCSADEVGFPATTDVRWIHNGNEIAGRKSSNLIVSQADASSGGNYTCIPYNQVGNAEPATVTVRIFAPPTFVQRLPMFTGTPLNRHSLTLRCIVECDPLCSVSWFKNQAPIYPAGQHNNYSTDRHFIIKSHGKTPDPVANLLHHVESTLTLDFDRWPGGGLTTQREMSNYSCKSSSTSAGPAVESSTVFRVHFPPRNISVEPRMLIASEKSTIEPFRCSADAFPSAKYYWQFPEGNRSFTGQDLIFRHPLRRDQSGEYVCTAYNDLGSTKASVRLQVMFKPSCRLRKMDSNEADSDRRGLHLRCDAEAFPENVTFLWYHNDEPLPSEVGANLHFRHVDHNGNGGLVMGNFSCEARNVAGSSERCAIRVNGPVAALMADSDHTFLLIIGATGFILLILVLVGILLCRGQSHAHQANGQATGALTLKYRVQKQHNTQSKTNSVEEKAKGPGEAVLVPSAPNGHQHFENGSKELPTIIPCATQEFSDLALPPDPGEQDNYLPMLKDANVGDAAAYLSSSSSATTKKDQSSKPKVMRWNMESVQSPAAPLVAAHPNGIAGYDSRPPPPHYSRPAPLLVGPSQQPQHLYQHVPMTLDRRYIDRHHSDQRMLQSFQMADATMSRRSRTYQPAISMAQEEYARLIQRRQYSSSRRPDDLWLV